MALTDENGGGIPATMLVGPATMGGNNGMPYPVPMYGMGGGQGNGGFGNDGGWWIVLLIIVIAALGGGWGGNNGGNQGGGYMSSAPIVISDNNGGSVQRGFDQAAVMAGINGIQGGISGLSTQLCNCCGDMQMAVANGFAGVNSNLCNGFAGVNSNISNGFAQAEIANNARQIADMQQSFAAQTATMQGFNGLQSQLAQCCCDNRLATNDLKYTIATENCADRAAASENTRDIIDSQTRGTQAILDKLCQLELDTVRNQLAQAQRENTGLQNQLNMANLNASQIAQTAQIQRGQVAEVDALYQRLRDCPVPSMPVYGMQPIFTCPNNNNNGCGCGCNGNNF